MQVRSVETGEAEIDLVILCRDGGPPPVDVWSGIEAQRGVRLRVHLVDGLPRPLETSRLDTITRARNRGSRLGSTPWIMFLDDDVIFGPGCVARLVEALRQHPGYAALAADYLGESAGLEVPFRSSVLPRTPHVGMGATLFRRDALAHLSFRWRPGACECWCCCEDLRRAGLGIAYLPGAHATHRRLQRPIGNGEELKPPEVHDQPRLEATRPSTATGARILTAFDRRHLRLFRQQFLPTLRQAGNHEVVTVVAYGLWPSERSVLEGIPGLEPVFLDDDGTVPAIRRLRDFQYVVARWPEATPMAHWDAGDMIFQGSLGPLWSLVNDHPDRILAVREPAGYPENPAVVDWTFSIHDPAARRLAFELISTRPFLNGGFVAGTARSLLAYLREADRLLHSPALQGTTDWGDQMALNLYCHTRPERWTEAPEGWNYTLYQRQNGEYRLDANGRFVSKRGDPIAVVHGNARTLKAYSLSRHLSTRSPSPGSGADFSPRIRA
jgi:hypothetical protein